MGGGSHSSFGRQEKNTVKSDSILQKVCPLYLLFNLSIKKGKRLRGEEIGVQK